MVQAEHTGPRLPLDGIRVLDLSRLVAGNMTSVVLADFGADVIKVEHPQRGDDLRRWSEDGVETWWKVYGRNKRSLALDLKDAEALKSLKRMAASSQVLIENFVPGKLEELGLGVDVLHALNPKLVVVRVSGWGQTGPYRHRPGFGTLVEAMSGFAHLNGFADRPPVLPPLAMADMYAGLYGAFGTLAALRVVEGGGQGQVVDVSLFESMYSTIASEAVKFAATGQGSQRQGNQAVNTAPRNIYACADGKYLALSASVQTMFERLARTIDRAELIDDARFVTNEARVRHCDALNAILEEYFARAPLEENLAAMEAAGVTVAPVLTAGDLIGHPYAEGRGLFDLSCEADMEHCPLPAAVPRLSQTPGRLRRSAPRLGEHTEEILAAGSRGEEGGDV
ncbi:MAG: CoA transferase [Candidatus Latescibacteria bacterium]|nr:CoA transferase [Candidatus Latescibacterota bacterium]